MDAAFFEYMCGVQSGMGIFHILFYRHICQMDHCFRICQHISGWTALRWAVYAEHDILAHLIFPYPILVSYRFWVLGKSVWRNLGLLFHIATNHHHTIHFTFGNQWCELGNCFGIDYLRSLYFVQIGRLTFLMWTRCKITIKQNS